LFPFSFFIFFIFIGSHIRVRSCSFLGVVDVASEHAAKKIYLSTPSPPLSAGSGDLRDKSPDREKLKVKERKILFSGLLFLFFIRHDTVFYSH
jgi:hypothetical protein